jgi:uncharacterized short protein YbdD (DUF466 family)
MPTSTQIGSLNAEILHNLSTIANDADMLNRVAKYLRRLTKKREDETLMTREEFFRKLDEAEEDYKQGRYTTLLPGESVTDMLRRQGYEI